MEILYATIHHSMFMAIPKKRGIGYLRSPVGHHDNDLSIFLRDIKGISCVSSDGYGLQIDTFEMFGDYAAIAREISNYLGYPAREVTLSEYEALFTPSGKY